MNPRALRLKHVLPIQVSRWLVYRGHCQVPSRDSSYIYDFEMLRLPKVNVSEGDHYLKVTTDGTASAVPYDLRVTVTRTATAVSLIGKSLVSE